MIKQFFIGQQPPISYAKAIQDDIYNNRRSVVKILARGKSISNAVCVALILINFQNRDNIAFEKLKEPKVRIYSEEIFHKEKKKNVKISAIEIILEKEIP